MKKEDKTIIEKIEKSLNNPASVVKALELLYNNQTADEQVSGETKHHNGIGFSGCDARTGTWLVTTVIAEGREKGRSEKELLRGKALIMGKKIASRYVSTQLLRAAKEKIEKQKNSYYPPTPDQMNLIIEYNYL